MNNVYIVIGVPFEGLGCIMTLCVKNDKLIKNVYFVINVSSKELRCM